MQYKYFYTKRTAAKIRSFYRNVAKKYQHTYSYEDMERNVRDAFFAIYAIERTLPRRRPTISRWAGFYMANTDKWYYAYTIEGDTITVVDACHAQNMYDYPPHTTEENYPPRHHTDASANRLCIRHCLTYRHRIAEATTENSITN